jgi:hypothetical protein
VGQDLSLQETEGSFEIELQAERESAQHLLERGRCIGPLEEGGGQCRVPVLEREGGVAQRLKALEFGEEREGER